MLRSFVSALVVVLAVGAHAAGPAFYMDDARGDDALAGTSADTAWRSLERVNAAVLQPGDRVLFRRGGVWRGQLVPHSGAAALGASGAAPP